MAIIEQIIEVEVECTCGKSLDASVKHRSGGTVFQVEPCEDCGADRYNEGHEEGYDKGYNAER
jgi:hypothetical protein